jgi:hypothetical protein
MKRSPAHRSEQGDWAEKWGRRGSECGLENHAVRMIFVVVAPSALQHPGWSSEKKQCRGRGAKRLIVTMTFVFVDRRVFSEKKWEKLKSRLLVDFFFLTHLIRKPVATSAAKSTFF